MYYKDINLLPGKKKSTKNSRLIIYVLAVFTILSYVGNYYVYEPLQEKWELENEIKRTEAKIALYGDTATRYLEAIQKNNEYVARTQALEEVLSNSSKATDIISSLIKACPEGLIIQNYSYSTGTINATVTGKSYAMIGQYITNLKKVPEFTKVSFGSIALGTKPMKEQDKTTSSILKLNDLFGGIIPDDVVNMITNKDNSEADISDYIAKEYGIDLSGNKITEDGDEAEQLEEQYTLSLQITVKEK